MFGDENYLPPDGLDWDLKQPCDDCPFTRAAPFHQGVAETLPQNVEAIEAHRFAHTCHKTDNRPYCDGPKTYQGERPKHCVGALYMLIKSGGSKWMQHAFVQAMDAGRVDVEDLCRRARADRRCFTLRGLLGFYTREILRRTRRRK